MALQNKFILRVKRYLLTIFATIPTFAFKSAHFWPSCSFIRVITTVVCIFTTISTHTLLLLLECCKRRVFISSFFAFLMLYNMLVPDVHRSPKIFHVLLPPCISLVWFERMRKIPWILILFIAVLRVSCLLIHLSSLTLMLYNLR